MRPMGRGDQCPQLGVERTQRGRRLWAVHDPQTTGRVEIPRSSSRARCVVTGTLAITRLAANIGAFEKAVFGDLRVVGDGKVES
jgi:hypothetical protein